MTSDLTPRQVIDLQMQAYNARDLDAYCALFADDAVIANLSDGKELSRGMEAIRRAYAATFRDSPNLHYTIKARIELGDFVMDHEEVNGIRNGMMEVVAIYEVRHSLIQSVRFIRK